MSQPAEELFGAVESLRFSALVNIASGKSVFLHCLEDTPEWAALSYLAETSKGRCDIGLRLAGLLCVEHEPTNERYERQDDAAVAAYLWALYRKEPGGAIAAARAVRSIPAFFWAYTVAEIILRESP